MAGYVSIGGNDTWVDDARGSDGRRSGPPPAWWAEQQRAAGRRRSARPSTAPASVACSFDRRGHGRTRDTDDPFHYRDMATGDHRRPRAGGGRARSPRGLQRRRQRGVAGRPRPPRSRALDGLHQWELLAGRHPPRHRPGRSGARHDRRCLRRGVTRWCRSLSRRAGEEPRHVRQRAGPHHRRPVADFRADPRDRR